MKITGLLIDAKLIDTVHEVIEVSQIDRVGVPFKPSKDEVVLLIPKVKKRFNRIKFRGGDLAIDFFISNEDEQAISFLLEMKIEEAKNRMGYYDAVMTQRIKENYGEDLLNLLSKKKDVKTKQQLLRMLDF